MRVLFVCQLNMVRSPMAEGLARLHGIDAHSCGLTPGEPDELMMTVMREKGVEMDDHAPRALHDFADDSFDAVIAFSPDARAASEAVFGADADVRLWDLPMPHTGSHDVRAVLDTYRTIRTIIETRIKAL